MCTEFDYIMNFFINWKLKVGRCYFKEMPGATQVYWCTHLGKEKKTCEKGSFSSKICKAENVFRGLKY